MTYIYIYNVALKHMQSKREDIIQAHFLRAPPSPPLYFSPSTFSNSLLYFHFSLLVYGNLSSLMTNKFKLFYIKKTLFFFFLFLFIDGYSYYQCQVIISLTGTALNTGRTKRLGIPHHLSSPLSKEERERKRKDVMIYVNTSEGT